MQDLRLVGVHDDGEHLLFSGAGGEMFQLPIDETLRVAVNRPSKTAPGPAPEPIAMSPRDIQARIRSGATAAEVAELSGMPLAKVERYEGPVLAEREYVAQQARRIEVASPTAGHEGYRSHFGDQPATLEEMVSHRLRAYGVAPETVEWDSWRRPDGLWNVVAAFSLPAGGHTAIGEEPPATWTFSPALKSLQNANRWAQQLSELEPMDGPVPSRRLSAVSDRPFDFETDAEAAARTATAQLSIVPADRSLPGDSRQDRDNDGLLDMLRSRRGHRIGVDEDADDALALMLSQGVPAAHPRPSEVPAPGDASDSERDTVDASDAGTSDGADLQASKGSGTDATGEAEAGDADKTVEPETTSTPAAKAEPHSIPGPDAFTRRRDARPSMLSRLTLAPRHDDADAGDALRLHDGVSTETREITIAASQLRPVRGNGQGPTSSPGLDELLGGGTSRRAARPESPEQPRTPDGIFPAGDRAPELSRSEARAERAAETPERQPAKPKRSSVPSWDDIVFGTRSE